MSYRWCSKMRFSGVESPSRQHLNGEDKNKIKQDPTYESQSCWVCKSENSDLNFPSEPLCLRPKTAHIQMLANVSWSEKIKNGLNFLPRAAYFQTRIGSWIVRRAAKVKVQMAILIWFTTQFDQIFLFIATSLHSDLNEENEHFNVWCHSISMTFNLFIGIRATAPKKLTFHCKEILVLIWIYVFCDDGWGDLGSEWRSRSFNGGFCWIREKVSVFSSGQVKQSSAVIFHGCELHSVTRAAHLCSPSISVIAYTIRACFIRGVWELPHLPCFHCTCHLYKMMTLMYSHPGPAVGATAGSLCSEREDVPSP